MDKRHKERMKRANKRTRSVADERERTASTSTESSLGRSRGRVVGNTPDTPPNLAPFQDLSAAETTNIDKRLNVLDELLNTEKDYLHDLGTVMDLYINPMRADSLVPAEVLPRIFSNIEEIHALHKKLYDELNAKISDIQYMQCIEQSISRIFQKSVSSFGGYVEYSKNYPRSIACIKEMCDKHSTFSEFLAAKQKEDPQNLRLIDYLIKPIQRLCKYPLLFRELLKCTADEHKDKAYMQETMDALTNLTNHVNEANERSENLETLKLTESSLSGLSEPLAVPGRKQLHSFAILVQGEKLKARPGRLFLFNNLVVLSKTKPKKQEVIEELLPSMVLADRGTPYVASPTKLKRSRSRGSTANVVLSDPNKSLQLACVATMRKYTIMCSTDMEVVKILTCIKDITASHKDGMAVYMSLEDQLAHERKARKELQVKTVALMNRISELEQKLEQEVSRRKNAEMHVKRKVSMPN